VGASTRRVVAARASSVVGGRKWATIGLFNHALCFPQRLWALGSTREKSSSRLAALAQTLWGEAGRWIPRARSRRGADSCHVSAAETSMPGQGWIARMKSTTRHVAGERAVAPTRGSWPEAARGLGDVERRVRHAWRQVAGRRRQGLAAREKVPRVGSPPSLQRARTAAVGRRRGGYERTLLTPLE